VACLGRVHQAVRGGPAEREGRNGPTGRAAAWTKDMTEVSEVDSVWDTGGKLGQADEVSCRPPNSEALNITMSMESVVKVTILSLAILSPDIQLIFHNAS
jgi:hypothetical protein